MLLPPLKHLMVKTSLVEQLVRLRIFGRGASTWWTVCLRETPDGVEDNLRSTLRVVSRSRLCSPFVPC
jgi:hypothetical protein